MKLFYIFLLNILLISIGSFIGSLTTGNFNDKKPLISLCYQDTWGNKNKTR